MPILGQHEGKGGIESYLHSGDYEVVVESANFFQFKNGNTGVEFFVRAKDGGKSKVGFPLAEGALWRLANWASACGFGKAERDAYDTDDLTHHQGLVGRHVMVRVGLDPKEQKYSEVIAYWRVGDTTPSLQIPTEPAPPPVQDEDDVPW